MADFYYAHKENNEEFAIKARVAYTKVLASEETTDVLFRLSVLHDPQYYRGTVKKSYEYAVAASAKGSPCALERILALEQDHLAGDDGASDYSKLCLDLAENYYYGRGGKIKNRKVAMFLYTKANQHKQNNRALYVLGFMYEKADSASKDLFKAKECYQKIIDLGGAYTSEARSHLQSINGELLKAARLQGKARVRAEALEYVRNGKWYSLFARLYVGQKNAAENLALYSATSLFESAKNTSHEKAIGYATAGIKIAFWASAPMYYAASAFLNWGADKAIDHLNIQDPKTMAFLMILAESGSDFAANQIAIRADDLKNKYLNEQPSTGKDKLPDDEPNDTPSNSNEGSNNMSGETDTEKDNTAKPEGTADSLGYLGAEATACDNPVTPDIATGGVAQIFYLSRPLKGIGGLLAFLNSKSRHVAMLVKTKGGWYVLQDFNIDGQNKYTVTKISDVSWGSTIDSNWLQEMGETTASLPQIAGLASQWASKHATYQSTNHNCRSMIDHVVKQLDLNGLFNRSKNLNGHAFRKSPVRTAEVQYMRHNR